MVASIQYIQNGADYYDQACRWLIKDQALVYNQEDKNVIRSIQYINKG